LLRTALPEFLESIEIQKQEFLPSLINSEKYSTPFRTVIIRNNLSLTGIKDFSIKPILDLLIRKKTIFATHLNQEYLTNLKWNVKTDEVYEESI